MLSTLILSERSYPAMPLAGQPAHHWFVHSGPLVLGVALLKYPAPTTDRDRTVSRRSEPNSRTALIGEQPNPWDLVLLVLHYYRCQTMPSPYSRLLPTGT